MFSNTNIGNLFLSNSNSDEFFLRKYKHIRGFEKTDELEVVAKNIVSYCFRYTEGE